MNQRPKRLRPREKTGQSRRASIKRIRLACLNIEQSIGRPIDSLNEMQWALDELYEQEWSRRKNEG